MEGAKSTFSSIIDEGKKSGEIRKDVTSDQLAFIIMGRFWQAFLFIGLIVWLILMFRALWPALKKPSENKQLLALFLISILPVGVLQTIASIKHGMWYARSDEFMQG